MSCPVCNGLPCCPVCSDEPNYCTECEGTGMDEEGYICEVCHGAGIIEDDEPDWDTIFEERRERGYESYSDLLDDEKNN